MTRLPPAILPAIPPATDAWLVTGIPGAGKSTISRVLAGRFRRGAHLEGDRLGDMIVGGLVHPGQAPREESDRQSLLVINHLCLLARSFARSGFTPVLDYVCMTRGGVARYRRSLARLNLHLVVLNPGKDTALARDLARPEKTVAVHWTHLEDVMRRELPGLGLWIDSRDQTPEQTVAHILRHRKKALVP
ncbi:MAG TPA: AAA family ATPase [Chloroflexota bacterium]|nr:AAA family ATPase [Chloroflexota bacterium]